jgi:hypothetical protein
MFDCAFTIYIQSGTKSCLKEFKKEEGEGEKKQDQRSGGGEVQSLGWSSQ